MIYISLVFYPLTEKNSTLVLNIVSSPLLDVFYIPTGISVVAFVNKIIGTKSAMEDLKERREPF